MVSSFSPLFYKPNSLSSYALPPSFSLSGNIFYSIFYLVQQPSHRGREEKRDLPGGPINGQLFYHIRHNYTRLLWLARDVHVGIFVNARAFSTPVIGGSTERRIVLLPQTLFLSFSSHIVYVLEHYCTIDSRIF